MPSSEHRILTKIIESGTIEDAMRLGLKEEHFTDGETRAMWVWLNKVWHDPATPHTLPTMVKVRKRYPAFMPTANTYADTDDLARLIADIKDSKYQNDVLGISQQFAELANSDPHKAIEVVRGRIRDAELIRGSASACTTIDTIEQIARERYYGAKEGAIYGIPWPWPCLTEDTLGKQEGEFYVFYGRMKTGKCICEGQRIMMEDGSLVPIEDVPEQAIVPSFTEITGQVRMAKAKRVVSGKKSCVEVTTESGLKLRSSNEHLYMVPGGKYKRICSLKSGDFIATSRKLPRWSPKKGIKCNDAHFLGLLIGDGNYTRNEVQFTTADPEILIALREHALRYGTTVNQGSRPIEYRIVGKGRGFKNPVSTLLRNLGLHGKKGPQKRAPDAIFSSSPRAIAAFLAGLMDTDGYISGGVKNNPYVSWTSASRALMGDVQQLLMRFGVRGRIKEKTTNFGTKAYNLFVYSKELYGILSEKIGPFMCLKRKRKALGRLAYLPGKRKRNADAIPCTRELKSLILEEKGDNKWPRTGVSKYNQGKLFGLKGRISRQWLTRLANQFRSEKLRAAASTDIVWEQIESITPIGKQMCYDICIEDGQDPNFVVEGFIVHNTWTLLYCAAFDFLNHNSRVLLWSREMDEARLAMRMASLLTKVDYQLFKKGLLPPKLEDKAFRTLRELQDRVKQGKDMQGEGRGDLLLLCGHNAPKTLAGLDEQIQKFQPDVIYLDSFYHIDSERSEVMGERNKRMAALSEDIKNYAVDNRVPIVAVHQANRAGEKTYGNTLVDLADTDVLAREADLIVRCLMRDETSRLWEEDYEVEFERIMTEASRVKPTEAPIRRLGRPTFVTPSVDAEPKGKSLATRLSEREKTDRASARIGLVMGGNREGVLKAFIIRAIPGYNFEVINDNPSMGDMKKWVEDEDKAENIMNSKNNKETKKEGLKKQIQGLVDGGAKPQ